MDELRSFEATRQGSPPPPTSSLKGMRGRRGSSQSQDPGLGLPADRSPWSRRLGQRALGQAHPGHQGRPSSPPPAPRLASLPPAPRGARQKQPLGISGLRGIRAGNYPEHLGGSREGGGGCVAGPHSLAAPTDLSGPTQGCKET